MPALKDAHRERFAQLFVSGKSQAEAHRLAGFTPNRKNAWAVRNRKDVSRRIDELDAQRASREARALERAAARYQVTTDRVIGELARIAFANSLDYWRVDSNGDPILDLAKITRDQGGAISEIIVDEYKDGRSTDAREVKRVRIKLADKRAALVDLGRHLGLFVDPSVVNLNVSNYFSERPPSMSEWRKEIELTAIEARKTPDAAGKSAGLDKHAYKKPS
jgi:phage terminase small subunit